MNRRIQVSVPGSTSNLGSGLDVLGLAVELYNRFTFALADDLSEPEVLVEGDGAAQLQEATKNHALQAFTLVMRAFDQEAPSVRIHQINNIPFLRGLGGSGTGALAGVIAAYGFLGKQPTVGEILDQALRIEGHPENITPSLIGGMVAATVLDGHVRYVRIPVPSQLTSVVYFPDTPIRQIESRKPIPPFVPFEDAVFNVSRASILVACLASGNTDMLPMAMEDRLHQGYRTSLMPRMKDLFDEAIRAGALGVALSGSGSGIFAFAENEPEHIAQALERAGASFGLGGYSRVLPIQLEGVKVALFDEQDRPSRLAQWAALESDCQGLV